MISRQSAPLLLSVVALLGVGLWLVQTMSTPEPDSPETAWQTTPPVTGQPAASSQSSGKVGTLSEMVVKLEQRLQQQGGSAEDWVLLGKTYQHLGRADEAEMAYGKARERGYSASKLDSVRTAIAQQTVQIYSATPVTLNASRPDSSAAQAIISGTLSIAPELQSRLPAAATLFIYARHAQQSGSAPLAAIRTQRLQFPIRFELNDSHAVVPGRTLSSAKTVVVGARLSQSGNASGQPGDLEALSQPFDVINHADLKLELNQLRQ